MRPLKFVDNESSLSGPCIFNEHIYTRIEKGSPQTGADTLHTICNLLNKTSKQLQNPA
jgi:hypothetical protein